MTLFISDDDPDLPYSDLVALRKSLERLRAKHEALCKLSGHRWLAIVERRQVVTDSPGTLQYGLVGWRCLVCRERED